MLSMMFGPDRAAIKKIEARRAAEAAKQAKLEAEEAATHEPEPEEPEEEELEDDELEEDEDQGESDAEG